MKVQWSLPNVWPNLLERSKAENHHVNLLRTPSQDLHLLHIVSKQEPIKLSIWRTNHL
jgi:hypothetical protein